MSHPQKSLKTHFTKSVEKADYIIAHNANMTACVLAAEYMRKGEHPTIFSKEHICLMQETTYYCKISNNRGGYKWPSLTELYAVLFKQRYAPANEYVLDIDFVGTGEPHETARLFAAKVGVPETICFVRAKNSQQSIQKLMPKTASMEEVVVYANEKNDHVPSGPFDVLIFTSPLNAESFFSNRAWSGEKVIAIGSTTAGMLAELGIKDVYTPAIPTEESIIELLLSLI